MTRLTGPTVLRHDFTDITSLKKNRTETTISDSATGPTPRDASGCQRHVCGK